jgi:thiamine-monophosphate kinase
VEKSEDTLIAWIASRYPAGDIPIGIGDDMAMLPPAESGLLITADMIMDGVDFDSTVHTPEQIGRKALAVSLSDCAAMAVRPRWALISLALPDSWSVDMAHGLYLGMERLARQHDCRIIGGDTNSWDRPLVIDAIIVAEPWPGVAPVRRCGMKIGDALWVTGSLGGSLMGHHLTFEPRVPDARLLAERLGTNLHAMIDLSDGLSIDARRMAAASQCGIEFDEVALSRVISDAAELAAQRDGRAPLEHALNDGEDYELLFAVGSKIRPGTADQARCSQVGMAVERGIWLRRADDSRIPMEPRGWQHFTDK